MKGKLIILVGISNSGKSTWASYNVQKFPTRFIRINRDDIRSLLYGYTDETVVDYYKRTDLRKLEKQVTRYEDTLIYDSLELGKTVIVDATHLKRSYLERFKYWNVDTHVKYFDIEMHEALSRNKQRSRYVDIDVIRKQYAQYNTLKKQLEDNPIDFTPVVLNNLKMGEPVFVFDIDGTLAHKGDRSAYEWHRVGEDEIDLSLASLTQNLKDKAKIIIATGRDGVCLPETEQWLEDSNINYDEIYIRPKGDGRPDWLIKQEMAQSILKDNYILGWFDDRLQVTRHLRMLGLNVYNVAHGNF